jgi:ABC-2 type transport system ATP-binding protein
VSVILQVHDLAKSYGGVAAVKGVSFAIEKGEVFGLLGPNGAGKTTTLECLEGLRRPDGGRMDILGVDPSREARKLRNLIGVQLQTSALPPEMRVDEAMEFFCAYHDVAPRLDLLQRLGLDEKVHSQYRTLSTGQQRRLALALAMAHRPPVLILDEPTAGLDVGSRVELHALIAKAKDEGTTVILATHDMAEAEKMADRVAILLRGTIVAEGTPRELTAAGAGLTKVSVRSEQSVLSGPETDLPNVERRAVHEDYAIFFSTDPGSTVAAILESIRSQGDHLIDLRVERPSLEERFLEITQDGGAQ